MKHLTDFERQFIAKAAFDWYTQHGYNADLCYYHGLSEYRLTIYLFTDDSLPDFPFLQHPDIKKVEYSHDGLKTHVCFTIPYSVKL